MKNKIPGGRDRTSNRAGTPRLGIVLFSCCSYQYTATAASSYVVPSLDSGKRRHISPTIRAIDYTNNYLVAALAYPCFTQAVRVFVGRCVCAGDHVSTTTVGTRKLPYVVLILNVHQIRYPIK